MLIAAEDLLKGMPDTIQRRVEGHDYPYPAMFSITQAEESISVVISRGILLAAKVQPPRGNTTIFLDMATAMGRVGACSLSDAEHKALRWLWGPLWKPPRHMGRSVLQLWNNIAEAMRCGVAVQGMYQRSDITTLGTDKLPVPETLARLATLVELLHMNTLWSLAYCGAALQQWLDQVWNIVSADEAVEDALWGGEGALRGTAPAQSLAGCGLHDILWLAGAYFECQEHTAGQQVILMLSSMRGVREASTTWVTQCLVAIPAILNQGARCEIVRTLFNSIHQQGGHLAEFFNYLRITGTNIFAEFPAVPFFNISFKGDEAWALQYRTLLMEQELKYGKTQ